MDARHFFLFGIIHDFGVEQSCWDLCEDTETNFLFGTEEEIQLEGQWLYFWIEPLDLYEYLLENTTPDFILEDDYQQKIVLYKL